MKGVIFAAGFGERLRPITESVPKPLLPVGNVPLIGYSLRLLAHHGITEVLVNLHHLAKSLREALGDGSEYGVKLTYSFEEEILGTGGGLRAMQEHLTDGPFVVLNGDTIMDVDLSAVVQEHRDRSALATMVLRPLPPDSDYGRVGVDQDGNVRSILEQGDMGEVAGSFMFAGAHVIDPRFLEYIPPDVNTCINRYAYTKALSNGELVHSYLTRGYWADVGTPQRYYEANRDALEQRMVLPHVDPLAGFAVSPKRDVPDVVRMGEAVDLGSHVQVRPPVLLGDGVKVGDNAVLGPYAIVGAGAQVGKEADVSASVLLPGVKVEAGRVVHGELMGKKASLSLVSSPEGAAAAEAPESAAVAADAGVVEGSGADGSTVASDGGTGSDAG